MSRVNIKNIAARAGVSVGTVSKVLNGDTSVKEKNRKAVEEAVEELHYNVNRVARSLAHKPITLGIILPSVFKEYFSPMIDGISEVVDNLSDYKVSAVYRRYSKFDDSKSVKEFLEHFEKEGVDGIVLGPYMESGNDKLFLERLHSRSIPVVMVMSELVSSKRIACVSIDAELSGKTAAELIAMNLKKNQSVAVFVGNANVSEHRIKAESFIARLKELKIKKVQLCETQDDPDLGYRITMKALKKDKDLGMIYVATGNSLAVCKAIEDAGRMKSTKVIATDLFGELDTYVKNGTVIGILDQHMKELGAMSVNILYRYLTEGTVAEEDIKIAPSVLLKSIMEKRLSVGE